MSVWSWIKGKAQVVEQVKPVVKEGEDIVKDLMEIIADIKAGRYTEVVTDTKQIALDVAEFAAEVEKIMNKLQPPVVPAQK